MTKSADTTTILTRGAGAQSTPASAGTWLWDQIRLLLGKGHSPEQIAGILPLARSARRAAWCAADRKDRALAREELKNLVQQIVERVGRTPT